MASPLLFPSRVLTATHLRPRLLIAALPLLVIGVMALDHVLMTRRDHRAPHRYFSAFAMLERATCGQGIDRFVPNALQHDAYGTGYLFECNAHGVAIVSAGPDGIYETADDTRSDR